MTAPPSRGKGWTIAAAAVTALVLAVSGFAARGRLLEEWYLHRLRQGDDPEERELVSALVSRRCQRLVPILLERAPEPELPLLDPRSGAASSANQDKAHWLDALRSPDLTPGLVAVVRGEAYPASTRSRAILHLLERRHPLDLLVEDILVAIEDPAVGLPVEAVTALAEAMPDDLSRRLDRLFHAMIASSSLGSRSALASVFLLWALQLPDEARALRRHEMEEGLLFLEEPTSLVGLIGALLLQTSRYANDPAKTATLRALGQRLVTFLRGCQGDDYPVLRQRASAVLQALGVADTPAAGGGA